MTGAPVSLRVTAAAARKLRSKHPWVFADAVTHMNHDGAPGDIAVLYDPKRRFLGVGLFDPTSPIRVRVLAHREPVTLDEQFLAAAATRAAAHRACLAATDTDGYRVIHGENDGLGGLVVDRYGSTLVAKLYSVAWLPHLRAVLQALTEQLPVERVVLRYSRAVEACEGALGGLGNGSLFAGDPLHGPVPFHENGLRFEADPVRGQKTGFFLDQRDNRKRVQDLSLGAQVLNVFSYSGGFSLYAARGGASKVVAIDRSAPAHREAERHFELNQEETSIRECAHEMICDDAFRALTRLARESRRFDLVIVDPPSFAKRSAEVPAAREAYGRLTALALAVLREGGLAVLASCSSRVDAQSFEQIVRESARRAGRPLDIIERTGHALDHPVSFPEGAYLKAIFARA